MLKGGECLARIILQICAYMYTHVGHVSQVNRLAIKHADIRCPKYYSKVIPLFDRLLEWGVCVIIKYHSKTGRSCQKFCPSGEIISVTHGCM